MAFELVTRTLLTYLLHSTILLSTALLLRLALRERRLALQEVVLRAGLVGGFLTTALQVGLDLRPIGGTIHVAHAAVNPGGGLGAGTEAAHPTGGRETQPILRTRPSPGASSREGDPAARILLGPSREPRWEERVVFAPSSRERLQGALAERVAPAVERASGTLRHVPWEGVLALAWGALMGIALARLCVAALRLRRLLRGRRPILAGRFAHEAARLARALGIRRAVGLCAAPRLAVPLATGVLRPEVCLPARAFVELGPDEQIALCAHELAHVVRRDPAWILVARAAEALAPLQPLNGWARRRLQQVAECLSDDLAVSVSARPAELARSLVDVASWLGLEPPLSAAAAGAVSARSHLGLRVERIMDPVRSLERPHRFVLPIAALAVLAMALVTPGVSGTAAKAETAPSSADALPPLPPAPSAQTPTPPRTPSGASAAPLLPAPPRDEVPPLAPPDQETAPAAAAPVALMEPPALAEPPPPLSQPVSTPARPRAPRAPRAVSSARPAAPASPAASAVSEAGRQDLERQIELISRRMEERARLHEGELRALAERMEAMTSRVAPAGELARLAEELAEAETDLAARTVTAGTKLGDVRSAEAITTENGKRAAEAAHRLAELHARLRELMSEIGVPAEEMRALGQRSRELAERARPTTEEVREIQRLSRELAREAVPRAEASMRERARAFEEARKARAQALAAAKRAQVAARRSQEEWRRSEEELRRSQEELRRSEEELHRTEQRIQPEAKPRPDPKPRP